MKNPIEPEALELETPLGLLCIRKDAVLTVEAYSYGSRNMECKINGIPTKEGYDFVIDALGWKTKKP